MTALRSLQADAPAVDRDAFLAEGYQIVRGVIDPADLAAINAEMAEMFAIQLRRLGLPVDDSGTREAFLDNAVRLLRADVATYISTARLTQMLPSAHRMLISEPIMQVAKALGLDFPVVSTRVSNHIMSDALKIPGGYHKSPAHQDWRSMQGSLDSVVFWIPTTPVTTRSHPLEVVPKSHLLGLLDTAEHIMTPTVSDERITDDLYRPLELQLGDVVIFSSFLVHRTGEDGDGLVRIAFSGRFNNAAEPTYVAHGYPTPYKYSYRTDLMVENFPTGRDLAAVFPAARIGLSLAVTFTVAIMQPYFLPYAGYFRLLAGSDLFVIYDCVQFPRRGWLHRNQLHDRAGTLRWLTLPLAPAPQSVPIRELAFPDGATAEMAERLRPFDLDGPNATEMAPLLDRMRRLDGRPVDYIVDLLEAAAGMLELPWRTVRSSSLDVPDAFRGQDRILEIARRLGADRYLNAPGGRDLYDEAAFAAAGLELAFLPAYAGQGGSILERLLHDEKAVLRANIADMVNNSESKLPDLQASASEEHR